MRKLIVALTAVVLSVTPMAVFTPSAQAACGFCNVGF
jgi:hypothetical protein